MFIPNDNLQIIILYGYFIWFIRMVIVNGIPVYVMYN